MDKIMNGSKSGFLSSGFFKKTFLFAAAALQFSQMGYAATNFVFRPPPSVYVRPGGVSYSWKFDVGTTPNPQYPGTYPVVSVGYYNVTAFNWIVTRGHFEYSGNNGASWTSYTLGEGTGTAIANPANIWRFVDTTPNNTTTANSFGCLWNLQSAGNLVTSGSSVVPDNAPTDITSDRSSSVILSTAVQGSPLAKLTPVDTGATFGGAWAIDSQSVPNLFTIAPDSVGNAATLQLGSAGLPTGPASVTVHYYDLYQTDTNGVPISGQGITKTYNFSVIPEATTNLDFTTNIFVNTYTTDDQSAPAIATLSDGNFVVVWQSTGQNRQSGSYHAIYGRRFNSAGVAISGEFLISGSNQTEDDVTPTVTPLDGGRFAVAYPAGIGSDYDINLRIVDANNTPSAAIPVNTTTTGNQSFPQAATLTNGKFVVVWNSENGDIRLQQFTSNGVADGSEVLLVNQAGYGVGVTALDNGSYAVSWADNITYDILTQVGAAGIPFDTGIAWTGYGLPKMTEVSGGFVLATESYGSVSGDSQIALVRFNNSGVKQGNVIQANAGTVGSRYAPSIATLTDGTLAVAWYSDSDDYDYDGIFGRRFQANGTPVDLADFEINEHRTGDQTYPCITGLAGAGFATGWTDAQATSFLGDIRARVLGGQVIIPAPGITSSLTASGTYGTLFADYTITASNTPTGFSATGLPAGLTVNTESGVISGTPTETGMFNALITATNAGGNGSATLVITIAKALATVTLNGGSQTYDGTGKAMTPTTTPNGLTVQLTYDGNADAPTNAGSYTVIATVQDANYLGSATNTLTIAKASAGVTLSGGSATYDGTGKVMVPTTAPIGLTVQVTYDGATAAPTNAGSYTTIGTIVEANYLGSVTNTLTIGKAALAVSADDNTRPYGDPNPTFTGNIFGLVSGDNLTASFSTPATPLSMSGSYPIIADVNDPDGKLGNYNLTTTNGTLTVTPLPLVLHIEGVVTNQSVFDLDIEAGPSADWAHVTAAAEANRAYEILVSTNLFDWSVLTNLNADPTGLLEFMDEDVHTNTMRFFRARIP
jgi:hypothetical protein